MYILTGEKGNYEVQKKIGSGGMCDILLCRVNGLSVAAKKIRHRANEKQRSDMKDQLETEIGVMKQLSSVHFDGVPKFIDKGEDFYVMEYVEGQTLNSIETDGRELVHIMQKLCDILIMLHENSPGILHLDIKPSNVLIRLDGSLCLLDFGNSKILSGYGQMDEKTGSIACGTIGYAAPEQFGRPSLQDCRTDIYQYGKLLLRLLGGSRAGFFLAKELEMVAKRCTKARASSRFKTMREVKKCLNECEKKAAKSKLLFCSEMAVGTFLFFASVISILCFAKGMTGFYVPLVTVLTGRFFWNDEKLSEIVWEMTERRKSGGKTGEDGQLFIDIVMTCDTIEI